jgi:hypothetical protein
MHRKSRPSLKLFQGDVVALADFGWCLIAFPKMNCGTHPIPRLGAGY